MKTIAAMDKRGFELRYPHDGYAFLGRQPAPHGASTSQIIPGVKERPGRACVPAGEGKINRLSAESRRTRSSARSWKPSTLRKTGAYACSTRGPTSTGSPGRSVLRPSSALVVLQGGEISTCFEVHNLDHPLAGDFIFGKIADGKVQFDEAKWQIVAGRSIDRLPYCEDCFCKYHCAGDCLSKTFSAGSESRFKPSGRCKINREITKFLILKKIARGKGLWMGYANGGASG